MALPGKLAHHRGQWQRARTAYSEGLWLRGSTGGPWELAASLEGLAGVAAGQHEPVRAARLWSAAARLRDSMGAPVPPAERDRYATEVAQARAAVGETSWAAACAEGCGMSLERVLAYALEDSAREEDLAQ